MSGNLSMIECWQNFHYIGTDPVNSRAGSQVGKSLKARRTTYFRCTSTGSIGRVKEIHIKRQKRFGIPNFFAHQCSNLLWSAIEQLSGGENCEAHIAGHLQIVRSIQWSPHS